MTQTVHHRLHVLEAADWKAGVITILEPESPYLPWRYAFGEARPGDYAMLVLGTDPVSVVTVLARIGEGGGLDGSLLDTRRHDVNVVDLTTLATMLGIDVAFSSWRFDDDDAEQLILALHESRVPGRPYHRWGHSSLTAARNLLSFNGYCDGCADPIDLGGDDARDNVHIHTVDPLPRPEPPSPFQTPDGPGRQRPHIALVRQQATDWPAILCRFCHHGMRDGGYTSFVEFRFAQHPECPQCGGGRTREIGYGMPANPEDWGPWSEMGGCVLKNEKWSCSFCDHRWS